MISKTQLNLRALLAMMLITSTVCVYIPQTIYFANQIEFTDSFLSLILFPTVTAIMFMALFSLCLTLMPKRIIAPLTSCLLIFSVMTWIQGDLISIDVGLIDGSVLNVKKSIDLVWVTIYALIFISAIWMQQVVNKHIPFVVLVIIIGQLAVTFYQVSTHQKSTTEPELKSGTEFEYYSTNKNVILIILDTFGSQVFQQIKGANLPSQIH